MHVYALSVYIYIKSTEHFKNMKNSHYLFIYSAFCIIIISDNNVAIKNLAPLWV